MRLVGIVVGRFKQFVKTLVGRRAISNKRVLDLTLVHVTFPQVCLQFCYLGELQPHLIVSIVLITPSPAPWTLFWASLPAH